jgi:hypothetical protein
MATARELLEQADALMRRNRRRGKGRLDASTLTGVLEARTQADEPSTVILPDTPRGDADAIVLERVEAAVDEVAPAETAGDGAQVAASPSSDDDMSLDTLADLPVLTDVVVEWPESDPMPPAAMVEVAAEPPSAESIDAFPASAEEARAAAADAPAIAIIERQVESAPAADVEKETPAAADAIAGDAVQEPAAGKPSVDVASEPQAAPFLDDDFILEIPPLESPAAAAPVPPPLAEPASPDDDAAWAALAEELRMQVLQRLDLFTDTGLREQLGERLSPIVERASTQMIETINRELGELVRAYVAEAIEREIETWRKRTDR